MTLLLSIGLVVYLWCTQAYNRHLHVLDLLIAAEMDVNARDLNGLTPWMLSAATGTPSSGTEDSQSHDNDSIHTENTANSSMAVINKTISMRLILMLVIKTVLAIVKNRNARHNTPRPYNMYLEPLPKR